MGDGRFTDDPLSPVMGSHAVVEAPELQRLLRYICKNGFAHHCAMSRSHVADVLAEAFETYLGWDVYRHLCGLSISMQEGDILIALSKAGKSAEINCFAAVAKQLQTAGRL